MVKSTNISSVIQPIVGPVDCACVIHGDAYDWSYVERLHNMLQRNLSHGVRLHMFTEATRPVPAPMIKHTLLDWGIGGPKKSWWYKMQLFNQQNHAGAFLYFDLDVIIVDNIDWIVNLPLRHFWSVKDFKYLWRPTHASVNSSVMWWDTKLYDHVWRDFLRQNLHEIIKQYRGDQDYINMAISDSHRRYMDSERVKSWRWQCLDGGYNFANRMYRTPGSGTSLPENTSVLIFHGNPKPHKLHDFVIQQHWI